MRRERVGRRVHVTQVGRTAAGLRRTHAEEVDVTQLPHLREGRGETARSALLLVHSTASSRVNSQTCSLYSCGQQPKA